MKTLLVLRHGKSSWKDTSIADFDRPLKKRGKRAAEAVGQDIRRLNRCPDLIISSAARRARETAEIVSKSAGCEEPVIVTEKLYMSGYRAYLQALVPVDAKHETVMLVGHNPDVENLVQHLTGQPVTLPTAALVTMEWQADSWTHALDASGRLVSVTTPGDLS